MIRLLRFAGVDVVDNSGEWKIRSHSRELREREVRGDAEKEQAG